MPTKIKNNTNHYILLVEDEKDILDLFKIKIILISEFIKSILNVDDILKNLKIDKVIEKPIHLENLKNEIQKLLVN